MIYLLPVPDAHTGRTRRFTVRRLVSMSVKEENVSFLYRNDNDEYDGGHRNKEKTQPKKTTQVEYFGCVCVCVYMDTQFLKKDQAMEKEEN